MGRRSRLVLGSLLLGLGLVLPVALLLTPAIHQPLTRTIRTILLAFSDDVPTGGPFLVSSTEGIRVGDPVFLDAEEAGIRPVASVAHVEEDRVFLRPENFPVSDGSWQLLVLRPPTGLGDLWRLAVPRGRRTRLERAVARRVTQLLRQEVLPEARKRLPGFLDRIDPRRDAHSREILDAVGQAVLQRLRPLGSRLARQVASELEDELDLLDRLGVLWKVARGDAEGLRKRLAPLAIASAERWWDANREDVLTAVGRGVAAEAAAWEAWLGDDVLPAVREALVIPVLEARKRAIERAAEDLVQRIVREVVAAPEGGFRRRFVAVLRMRLLDKSEPLLLLVPKP